MTTSVGTIAQLALRRLGVRIVPLDDSPTLTEMVPVATIATAALVELGVIASDETPIPSDQALMLDKVALGTCRARCPGGGLVAGRHRAARVHRGIHQAHRGNGWVSSFGKAIDPAIVALLEARVRKGAMVLSADTNAQQAVQAVHDDLVMRGIARWTSLDIPDPLADPYATLAADALAPLFGGDTDPRDTQDAIVAIYRYVALPSSGETVSTAYF